MNKIWLIFKNISNISVIKTLYFNFKALPFFKAIHMPIIIGKRTDLKNIGKIVLNYNGAHKIHIGSLTLFNTSAKMPTIWDNQGIIIINGPIVFFPSSAIYTSKNGVIEFMGNNRIGAYTQILCCRNIRIGINTGISWNCQICDSDFHFFKNIDTNKINPRTYPIDIGNNVWIGNHVIIGKGVKLADGCICGMNSMITKSCLTPNTILIGSPAKNRPGRFARIFDLNLEAELATILD